MKFVYPEFLWALIALSIPIIIHLFNFRRIKKVYFSNVDFLKEVKTKTNAFRRIKHFLVLLARLGFVFFLVLAFAQPYLPSKNQKNIKNLGGLVNIYLDNSNSMQSKIGNNTYFDLASSYITELVKVFPESAQFQLITNNFENKEQYPIPANEVIDRLTETKYANTYRKIKDVLRRQFSMFERYSPNKKNQVFWFTDFQKSTIGDLNKVKLDTNNRYYIIPIKSKNTQNILIDSVWLSNPFIKNLESNQVNVSLKSFYAEKKEDLILKLFIDGQQVSTTTVNLPAKGQANTSFNFTVSGQGWKSCKITFEDNPVTFDNEYYFVINASPTIEILHLFNNSDENYINDVYSNENIFSVRSFNINNLDYQRIDDAELVVLDGVNNIEGELKNKLRKFINKGGSLAVFPSETPNSSFTTFLSSIGIGGVKALNPTTLENARKNTLALPNTQNPFFKGVFESIPNNMSMPFANPTIRWSNSGNKLLSFKNQRPFLSLIEIQNGKVYVCASPLNAKYSNFAKNAIFVPIMYQLASKSKQVVNRLAYSFQEKSIRVRLKSINKNQVFKLQKDNAEIIPAQRIVNDQLFLEIPEEVLTPGFYKVFSGKKVETILAFNYDKLESNMNFYSLEEVKSRFAKQKNIQVFDFSETKNFIADFKAKNLQINYWKLMLIIALGFLLAETLIIRLF